MVARFPCDPLSEHVFGLPVEYSGDTLARAKRYVRTSFVGKQDCRGLLQNAGLKFEQWLLLRSRTLLLGLVAANVCLALWLNATEQPLLAEDSGLLGDNLEIKLLAEVPTLTVAKPMPRVCRLWGPESDPQAFATLVAELDATGGFPELQKMEVQGAPDYLVYIGELASRENAKRVARELIPLRIESYIVNRDNAPPILSVGVFSNKGRADKQMARVSALGYDVFVELFRRVQTVYNLAAHVSVDSKLYKSSTSACMTFAHTL